MKDTDYAFAVARIRANEPSLLGAGELEQLISAPSVEDVLRLLEDKGWNTSGAAADPNEMLNAETRKMWKLLTESAPEPEELSFLVAKNDFHNIKAALKALISNQPPEPYFLFPNTVSTELIWNAVREHAFSRLPKEMEAAAKEAYEVLVTTNDAQLTDIILDRAALEAMLGRAKATENRFCIRLAELMCVTADLKIAVRAAYTEKDEFFLQRALAACDSINKNALALAASRGMEEALAYLGGTPYSAGLEALDQSFASFEKWCDELILKEISDARRISFGLEPLAAYYIAKDSELKTVRILLSCKKLGLSAEAIKERVRALYV